MNTGRQPKRSGAHLRNFESIFLGSMRKLWSKRRLGSSLKKKGGKEGRSVQGSVPTFRTVTTRGQVKYHPTLFSLRTPDDVRGFDDAHTVTKFRIQTISGILAGSSLPPGNPWAQMGRLSIQVHE